MSLKEKAKKIDECLIACINFEKKLEQFHGIQFKMDKLQGTYENLITKDQLEEMSINVDHQKLDIKKVEGFVQRLKEKSKEFQVNISELSQFVILYRLIFPLERSTRLNSQKNKRSDR